jgi:hypothetical protein
VEVVVGHPGIQQLLGLGEGVEAAAGEQLGPQGLVELFDLAGGGRAADAGEPVGDPLLAADACPEPEGPRIATHSPAASRSTAASTGTAIAPRR